MKRITRFKKRTWVVLGVVAVIAAMASVGAYAYFTSTGAGTGTATVGVAMPGPSARLARPAVARFPDPTVRSGIVQTSDYHVKNGGGGKQYLTSR